jgi:pimeloyl-ACP methyl ester carboxylesterase
MELSTKNNRGRILMISECAFRRGTHAMVIARAILLLLVALLTACATSSPGERRNKALVLAATQGWQLIELPAGIFTLAAFVPSTGPSNKTVQDSKQLTIYIEGDGYAWSSLTQPSSDPTPKKPIALELALQHSGGAAAYLARPCQFLSSAACDERYWTSGRFSTEIVQASDVALDQLKTRFGAEQLVLVGYSGGGGIATLLAARRKDVALLVTVAGNLDHAAWSRHHGVSPLSASLNSTDELPRLIHLKQVHFVGADDRVIPPKLTQGYAARFPIGQKPIVRVIPGYDHHCCWVTGWSMLWSEIQQARFSK